MATKWTIVIDWDRVGEFSGDDIATSRVGGAYAAHSRDLATLT